LTKKQAGLRLSLDDVILRLQPFGGISTYWRELTAGLTALRVQYDLVTRRPAIRIEPAFTPGSLFHSSYYRFGIGRGARTITTVHDLIHERGLLTSLPSRMFVTYRKALFRLTDGFVCVSEQTKRDLLEIYPNESRSKPIQVAQHGNPLSSFIAGASMPPVESTSTAREKVFVFVGTRQGYKSFGVALEAFSLSGLSKENYRLVCTGAPFSDAECEQLDAMGLRERVISTGQLSTEDIYKLYGKALALIYPSIYEGFGLPVLEAMTFGCIPLVADIDPMRSISQGVVSAFPPGDASALALQMQAVTSPEFAAAAAKRAQARARDFEWKASIESHVSLYRLLGATH